MEWKVSEKMLFVALSAYAAGQKRADFSMLSPTPGDWNELFQLADIHQLLPVVYEMSYQSPELEELLSYEKDGVKKGQALFEKVRKKSVHTIGRQTYRADLFLTQYDLLTAAGVHPVVLKGIVLRDIYQKGDHRISTDEDIWVPSEDFMKAVSVFQEAGFHEMDEIRADAQEIGWQRKDGSYIELHRTLFGEERVFGRELSGLLSGAYERSVVVTLQNGRAVRTLSPEDHFLYLILHAYKHFVGPGVGIRQVMDIGLLGMKYREEIRWEKLLEDLKSIRAEYFTAAIFWICRNTLGIPVASQTVWDDVKTDGAPLLKDMMDAGLYGSVTMERLHTATITLNQVEAGRTNQKTSIWKTAFPPKEKLVGSYPELKDHPGRLPIVWIKRLWRYRKETKKTANNDTMETLRLGKQRTELLKQYKIIE